MYIADLVQEGICGSDLLGLTIKPFAVCGRVLRFLPKGWGGKGGGVLHKVLYGKAPPGGPVLTLLHIIFTVKVPLLYTFY